MSPITLNLHAVNDLVDTSTEWSDLDTRFRALDPRDRENRAALVCMLRELIEEVAACVQPTLYRLDNAENAHVHVFADFHCDEHGEITNDNHLALSVMVGARL